MDTLQQSRLRAQESFTWPQIFRERRIFNPKAENEPYTVFLTTRVKCSDDIDIDSDSEDDESDHSGTESEPKGNEDDTDVKGQKIEPAEATAIDHNLKSLMRLFMGGEGDHLQSRDQIDMTVRFCDNQGECDIEDAGKKRQQPVAILDDRNYEGYNQSRANPVSEVNKSRLFTIAELSERLAIKVYYPSP